MTDTTAPPAGAGEPPPASSAEPMPADPTAALAWVQQRETELYGTADWAAFQPERAAAYGLAYGDTSPPATDEPAPRQSPPPRRRRPRKNCPTTAARPQVRQRSGLAGPRPLRRRQDGEIMADSSSPEAAEELREDWGDAFRENMYFAGKVIASFHDTDFGRKMDEAGLLDHPDLWRRAQFGRALVEDAAPKTGRTRQRCRPPS